MDAIEVNLSIVKVKQWLFGSGTQQTETRPERRHLPRARQVYIETIFGNVGRVESVNGYGQVTYTEMYWDGVAAQWLPTPNKRWCYRAEVVEYVWA